MIHKHTSTILMGFLLLTLSVRAMEMAPTAREEALLRGTPTLRVERSPQDIARIQNIIDSYNEIETPKARAFLKREYGPLQAFLGLSLAQLTLSQSLLTFANEIDKATKYSQAFIEKAKDNNFKLKEPYSADKLIEEIMPTLKTRLRQFPILKGADDFHIAVVASEDPGIKNWLYRNIDDPNLKEVFSKPTEKPYKVTPLYLAHVLGKNDIIALFDKYNIKLGRLSPFHKDLLQAAIDSRKSEKKKIPSIPFQRTLLRDPKKYIADIRRLVTNVRTDVEFNETLQKEHPEFYAWLMSQGVEYIRKAESS